MMLTVKELSSIFRKLVVVDDDGLIFGLEEACRAVIEANNKRVLADLEPDVLYYAPDTEEPTAAFSLSKVSALIQRNEALGASLKELEAQAEMYIDQINSLIKKLPPRPDLQPHKVRFA